MAELTPRLDPAQIRQLVDGVIAQRHRYLAALEQEPSPLYLLDHAALAARSQRLKAAFSQALPDVGFYYAMKSNHHSAIAAQLVHDGFGLDVSSGLELELALGANATDIVFSGPGKRPEELRLAVQHADRVTVLLDSFTELGRLEALASEAQVPVRVGVRLTTQTNGLWRKFGIPLADLVRMWEAIRPSRWLRFGGLQFHTSWNRDPSAQVAFLVELGEALAAAPAELRAAIGFLDVGGGYWPEEGEWLQPAGTAEGRLRAAAGELASAEDPLAHHALPAAPIEDYAAAVAEAVRTHLSAVAPLRICIEPGRWLCHGAMHLLLTVLDRKPPDLVITDAGTNAIGWERFETDYFPVINLSHPSDHEHPCLVLGSLCTPHDVWGYACFGEPPDMGDVLLIPNQGAYTYSLRQQFIKPLPGVVSL